MRLADNLVSCAALLAIPAVVAVAFPFEALTFRASSAAPSAPDFSAALVTLDAKDEIAAVHAAKSAWRQGGGPRKERVDLLLPELPGDFRVPMAPIGTRSRLPAPPVATDGVSPYLPSQRAPAPERIVAEPGADELPFPREELLRIN